jgi:hypothetical protein
VTVFGAVKCSHRMSAIGIYRQFRTLWETKAMPSPSLRATSGRPPEFYCSLCKTKFETTFPENTVAKEKAALLKEWDEHLQERPPASVGAGTEEKSQTPCQVPMSAIAIFRQQSKDSSVTAANSCSTGMKYYYSPSTSPIASVTLSPQSIDPSLTLTELLGHFELLVALQQGLRSGHGHEACGRPDGHYGGHIRV